MPETIRFLGGPADQKLRAIPEEVDRILIVELGDLPALAIEESEPDVICSTTYHEYRRAFPGSSYFKYQGISDRGGVPGPAAFQDW